MSKRHVLIGLYYLAAFVVAYAISGLIPLTGPDVLPNVITFVVVMSSIIFTLGLLIQVYTREDRSPPSN